MGNSESSSQLPAGAGGRRGVVVQGRKSGEENDATSSSAAVRATAKVGSAVARAVQTAFGACFSANSLRSEHPIEDDLRRRDMLAGEIVVEDVFGGGGERIARRISRPGFTVALRSQDLSVAEDRVYQLAGGGGDGVGDTTEGGEGELQRRRTRRQRGGAAEEVEKKGTAVEVAVARQRVAVEEEKGPKAAARQQRGGRRRRQQPLRGKNGGNSFPVKNFEKTAPRTIKFMTLNVWKQEGQYLQQRIGKIGHLVEKHSPDIIFFQEVTRNIKRMFQTFGWWDDYNCSDFSENAIEGDFCVVLSKFPVKAERCVSSVARKLPGCNLDVGIGRRLYVANGHLKRPDRPGMHSELRRTQVKEARKLLNCLPNAVFGGDMNWDEHTDGEFPLPRGWVDAWTHLEPDSNGWTYDTKSNKSLKGRKLLQKRPDRFVCKLKDFMLEDIEIIGNGAKPPSDHFGLLFTISYK